MRVDRRRAAALTGAVAVAAVGGGLAGYTQGGLWAGVGGMVGAVAGGSAAAWWARNDDRRRTKAAARVARALVVDKLPTSSSRVDLATAAPSRALDPDEHAARNAPRFWGRRRELEILHAWAADAKAPSVCLLTGPPASGKTRLSLELAKGLPTTWFAGRLRGDRASQAIAAILACGEPTLVVVEHGESPDALATFLADLSAFESSVPANRRVKVLLLSRNNFTLSLLKQRLRPPCRAILDDALTLEIGSIGAGEELVRRCAEATSVFCESQVGPVRSVNAIPEGALVGEVVARALIAARSPASSEWSTPVVLTADATARALAGQERLQWSDPDGAPIARNLRELAVAALLLVGPANMNEALTALRRLKLLRDARTERLAEIASWVHDNYPRTEASRFGLATRDVNAWLESPSFDLLLAGLVCPVLEDPDAWRALTARLDPVAAARVIAVSLTVADSLSLAWSPIEDYLANQPRPSQLRAELATHRDSIFGKAAPHRIDAVLALMISHSLMMEADLERIDRAIAGDNTMRASLVALRRDQLRRALASRDARSKASALTLLANALARVGEDEESLAIAREAEALWRELAEADPAAKGDHVSSLIALGAGYLRAGRPEEGLQALYEADSIVSAIPAPGLGEQNAHAEVLRHLAYGLDMTGQFEQALEVAQRAEDLWRNEARHDVGARRAHAESLVHLGWAFSRVGLDSESVAASLAGERIWRELSVVDPERNRDGHGDSLVQLGHSLALVGSRQEAVAACSEAEAILRTLASEYPGAYRLKHANSLTRLGESLRSSGERQRALAADRSAVAVLRELHRDAPAATEPFLANALSSLQLSLSVSGLHGESLTRAREVESRYRALSDKHPRAHMFDHCKSMTNLSVELDKLRLYDEALCVDREAARLWNLVAAQFPKVHSESQAQAVSSLAIALRRLGREEEAREVDHEAALLWLNLGREGPPIVGQGA